MLLIALLLFYNILISKPFSVICLFSVYNKIGIAYRLYYIRKVH